jgi:hypothetical protein
VFVNLISRNKKKPSNKRNKNFLRPDEGKNHSGSYLTLDEPSMLTKNNIFTILSSLRKSQGSSQLKAQTKNLLHEVHHLKTASDCYITCISLLKDDLMNKFKIILSQIRKYNQDSILIAYKNKIKKTIHTLISCYENLAFVTILNQNFYSVKKWTGEALSFLSNIEKGYLGFQQPKSKRLKINFNKSFSENFNQNSNNKTE